MATVPDDSLARTDHPEEPGSSSSAHQESASAVSRRERHKQDKQQRIVQAASDLFAEHGYAAVTTEAIAEAADVGTGTLFRYAGSKAQLLVQVMNDRLRLGTDQGLALARAGAGPVEAILAMLRPVADEIARHPENALVHQRETLFGSGPLRDVAAQQSHAAEAAVREVLTLHAGPDVPPDDLTEAAHVLYGALWLELVQVGVGRLPADELLTRARRTATYLVSSLPQPR